MWTVPAGHEGSGRSLEGSQRFREREVCAEGSCREVTICFLRAQRYRPNNVGPLGGATRGPSGRSSEGFQISRGGGVYKEGSCRQGSSDHLEQ